MSIPAVTSGVGSALTVPPLSGFNPSDSTPALAELCWRSFPSSRFKSDIVGAPLRASVLLPTLPALYCDHRPLSRIQSTMEFRQLGHSGLQVPVLSLGAGTFGGGNEFFKAWGASDVAEATRLVDVCLDAGANLFDTADVYSRGLSEEILGKAIAGKRNRVLISTKATFAMGDGPNESGSSRYHLIQSCEDSLRRLAIDHIDIYHMHGFDALTPVEETLSTLDTLVKSGKVRYIACSNFSGWHLMKSLAVSDKYGWARYVGHQVYYSLIGREYEWELMPLALDQG